MESEIRENGANEKDVNVDVNDVKNLVGGEKESGMEDTQQIGLKDPENWDSVDKPHRHPSLKEGEELASEFISGCDTLGACFEHICNKLPLRECLGYRSVIRYHKDIVNLDGIAKEWDLPELGPICYLRYKEVQTKVHAFSSGLVNAMKLKQGDNFGIYCNTRMEWLMTAHACFLRGIVVATCYANLGVDALVHVINQCELTSLLVTPDNFKTLDSIKDQIPTLKTLIYLDEIRDYKTEKFELIPWKDIAALGKKEPIEFTEKVAADDTAVIMYTSGSTGLPKGVMVSHKNLLTAAAGVVKLISPTDEDYYLGYLPLAHILELAVENGLFFMGIRIGYGNPRTLIEIGVRNCKGDIAEIRPTVMVGVPRVWDTIKKGAMGKLSEENSVVRWLFNAGFEAQKKRVVKHQRPSKFWNWLVFDKLQARLGGRMRILVSGGAPLSEETHEFLKVLFNNSAVIQGYGLTETCGGGTIQDYQSYQTGNVGYPLPCCEIKLIDDSELGYLTTDKPCPRGEVVIRGNNITKGYYKDEQRTKESFVFDKEGRRWFRTGDIGQWLPNGCLQLVDRKKNLIKLSGGEFVSLETLEMLAGNSHYIAPNGICVFANPLKPHPVAIVCLNIRYVEKWKETTEMKNLSAEELSKDPRMKKIVLDDITNEMKKNKRAKIEYIKRIWLAPEPFSVENECLTAAMKIRREGIRQKYGAQIEQLFE